MGNNLLGGLGGLMKGLSGFMPQDDPDTKLFQAQTEVADLEEQANGIYAEIGKEAYGKNPSAWPQADRLRLVLSNLDAAKSKQDALVKEKQAAEQAKAAADSVGTCPSCGYKNSEQTKFCSECGTKLGAARCRACGIELAPGTRFCGECGSRQGE